MAHAQVLIRVWGWYFIIMLGSQGYNNCTSTTFIIFLNHRGPKPTGLWAMWAHMHIVFPLISSFIILCIVIGLESNRCKLSNIGFGILLISSANCTYDLWAIYSQQCLGLSYEWRSSFSLLLLDQSSSWSFVVGCVFPLNNEYAVQVCTSAQL